jgi:hypothetical protein
MVLLSVILSFVCIAEGVVLAVASWVMLVGRPHFLRRTVWLNRVMKDPRRRSRGRRGVYISVVIVSSGVSFLLATRWLETTVWNVVAIGWLAILTSILAGRFRPGFHASEKS